MKDFLLDNFIKYVEINILFYCDNLCGIYYNIRGFNSFFDKIDELLIINNDFVFKNLRE